MPGADLWIDGARATVDDLIHQALVNYGAYTSFVVAGGRVRGLDRHLARLGASAPELFGHRVEERVLRARIGEALGDREDAFVRVSLFARDIGARRPDFCGAPNVMVAVFPPVPPLATGPVRLELQPYARELAHLKHVATFGLVRARRQAVAGGFDDALFVDPQGRISEGSLWNIGFLRSDTVVWPEAPMLAGVSQALIREHLADVGLKQETRVVTPDDLSGFDGAFMTSSTTPACAVRSIAAQEYFVDPDLIRRVAGAWTLAEPQPV